MGKKMAGVEPGALLLLKGDDGEYSLRVFRNLNSGTGHILFDWGVNEGSSYTALSSSWHCSKISKIQVLKNPNGVING
jgi:hypothetical protein